MNGKLFTQHAYGKDDATQEERLLVEIIWVGEGEQPRSLHIPGDAIGPLKYLLDRLIQKYPHLVGQTDQAAVKEATKVIDVTDGEARVVPLASESKLKH